MDSKRLRIFQIALLFGTLLQSSVLYACASDFEQGMKAYEEKDYQQAFTLMLRAAEQGNPHAQLAVSGMYKKGLGTPVDYHESYKWLKVFTRNKTRETGDW